MSANPLLRQMQKTRERDVKYKHMVFTLRRVTPGEELDLRSPDGGPPRKIDLLRKAIVNFSGVTESDLFPSGGDAPVEFDKDVAIEMCNDNIELMNLLVQTNDEMIADYIAKTTESLGN